MTQFNKRFANHCAKVAVAISAFCLSAASFSLQGDRSQPITIDANTAERDELAGTTTYAGNVEMAQGSMRINADKIVIFNTKDKVTKIIASGKPASYEQKPSEKEGKVVARANVLEYQIDQETLRLLEQASLQQEGTSLSGNTIEYDVRKSVVKAGSSTTKNQRVRMVIPPKALQANDKPTPKSVTPSTMPPNTDKPQAVTPPEQAANTTAPNAANQNRPTQETP